MALKFNNASDYLEKKLLISEERCQEAETAFLKFVCY